MHYLLSLLVSLFVMSAAYAADDFLFELEPTRKSTVTTTRALPAGARILLQVDRLKENETLYLFRCGELCNTAKRIQAWNKASFTSSNQASVVLAESGEYYFWIQQKLESGEVGPVFGVTAVQTGGWLVTYFRSDTIVSVSVDHPLNWESRAL
jgi:hypothetical protein